MSASSRSRRDARRARPASREPRRAGPARAPDPARPKGAGALATRGAKWAWPAALLIGFAALAWSCRGFMPGVPVADDYAFLARLAFQHPLDPFDSMGATYYWRPLSRQVYFSAIGPLLFAAPWLAAAINALLLGATATLLYRLARRGFPPLVAAAIAVSPLLAEPARALIVWPSGAQHLMAGVLALLVIHEAMAGRWPTAALAAVGGLLAHESAVLGLLALPIVAWRRGDATGAERRRARAIGIAAAAGIAVLWALAYTIAVRHGVALPPRPGAAAAIARLPELMRRAVPAALDLEDQHGGLRIALWIAYGVLAAIAVARLAGASARPRLRRIAWVAALAFAAFLIGALPLTQLLPDWNAWRAWVPSVGLVAGIGVLLAIADSRLAVAWAGVRLIALLAAPPSQPVVSKMAPPTPSHMSFIRLVRLQRTVESTRRVLERNDPHLPRGATVRFWNLPRLAEVGFQGSLAPRVWYRDSTLVWGPFGGVERIAQHLDAVLEYQDNAAMPARPVELEAVHIYAEAVRVYLEGRFAESDTLLAQAAAATQTRGSMYASLMRNRARANIGMGNVDRAEAFNMLAYDVLGGDADFWHVKALIAYIRNDRATGEAALRTSLKIDPQHPGALQLAHDLGIVVSRSP